MIARALLMAVAAACGGWVSALAADHPTPKPAPASVPALAPGLPTIITGELPTTPAHAPAAAPEHPAPLVIPAEAPVEEHSSVLSGDGGEAPPVATPALDGQSLNRQAAINQLAAQLALAQRAAAAGDTAAAEGAYQKLLTLPTPTVEKRNALLQMAAFYKTHHLLAKSAAAYEKILALFPEDPANPTLYFDLGRVYRDAGLYDLAIGRFYSVLNAAISQNDGQEETRARRNLSLLARFEIAEASYAKGDFAAASKFYSRLQLLELPPTDRPTVAFKNAQSLFQLTDLAAAAAALRSFIEDFPASPQTPEARNLLARAFQKLKRPREATDAVLALLRLQKQAGDNGNLTRWQKETGRQVAAQFYEDGDYRSAVTIYQTLATLDPAADWQWPIVYEIGLCFERLGLPDRAKEAYAYLQRPLQDTNGDNRTDSSLPPAMLAIRGMAKWRQEHLAWQQVSDTQLQALLGPLRKGADVPAEESPASPAATPAPASAPASAAQATPPPLAAPEQSAKPAHGAAPHSP